MRAIYRRDPEARIKSAFADYRGSEDFEQKFPSTGDRNVGPPIDPIAMRHVCACSHSGYPVNLSDSPDGGSYRVKQSTIGKCPHLIFDLSHYRTDGTCKCNDPDEQARMIREWGYTRADFDRLGVTA
jgi:hypothetical protein